MARTFAALIASHKHPTRVGSEPILASWLKWKALRRQGDVLLTQGVKHFSQKDGPTVIQWPSWVRKRRYRNASFCATV
jgi:hypothetical protein